jgi:hypothetical protein
LSLNRSSWAPPITEAAARTIRVVAKVLMYRRPLE